MTNRSNQTIRTKTSWFDADASERSTGSTLQVRRCKKKVEPMEEMKEIRDDASADISLSEAEGTDFFPIMEISGPSDESGFQTLAEEPHTFEPPVAGETMSLNSLNFENVDLDMSTRLRNEATNSIFDVKPAKHYKEQNTVPQAVLNQLKALQMAMEKSEFRLCQIITTLM